MLLAPTLSRTPENQAAFDQQQLYALGLDHVRRLSRRLWTDHNLHDPGITTLELLCYALTDLAYRTRFPIEDLLATPENKAENMATQFWTPRQILPNRPLTVRDYRKLLIDLPGIKNAWIDPLPTTLYADTLQAELRYTEPHTPGVRTVQIAGRYRVRLEYMEDITTQAQQQAVQASARACLEANRNLCEDFAQYQAIESQPYSLCAELELLPEADPVEISAQIRFQIAHYLSPVVRCYSLSQMLARQHPDGSPYSVAEIFEGPALQCGFIDDAELDEADLRQEIRLSDIISLIMDIPGVLAIRDIVVNALSWQAVNQTWEAIPPVDKWRMTVPDGKQPILSNEVSRLACYKRGMPIPVDSTRVNAHLASLQDAERQALETFGAEDIPIPLGQARDIARYHSFQHHFPEVYGISAIGLPSHADAQRSAQALQLKAYLLFFDQIMANYFAQLAQLPTLFRRTFADDYAHDPAAARTCFAQWLDSLPQIDKLYQAGVDATTLADLLENETEALERRNQILDHLLARFAEDFHHYANLMRSLFGSSTAAAAQTKSRFLMQLPTLGAERSLAWNKCLQNTDALWNSTNISGLERRIAQLLGIGNSMRRNLSNVSYDVYAELDTTPDNEYRFRVKHPITGKILLSSSTHYTTPEDARQEMQQAIECAQTDAGYVRKMTGDGKHYFDIINAVGDVIARRIEYFVTTEQLEAAIQSLITHLRGEGMYLIENLLLLPDPNQPADPFLPICVDPNCTDCADDDPYSYRLHIVLPAYAGRFHEMEFRRFVEDTIRQETPAHILPKICWVNTDDMAKLEQAYHDWILLCTGVTQADRTTKLRTLIDVLFRIKSIYPSSRLHDCGSNTTTPPFILGRTVLGSDSRKA